MSDVNKAGVYLAEKVVTALVVIGITLLEDGLKELRREQARRLPARKRRRK